MSLLVSAKRTVASNGRVMFFQLLSEGQILESITVRKIESGMLIRKMEPHERWGYMVFHQGDFVTAIMGEKA
jgi:hypothetical protein